MPRQIVAPDKLLEVAEKLRTYARETTNPRYSERFRRGAIDLEIEAVGWAAASAVARALRQDRSRRASR
jgi:hypothetical protein